MKKPHKVELIREPNIVDWCPEANDFIRTTDEELKIIFEEGEKHFKAAHTNCSDSVSRTNFLSTVIIAMCVALTGFSADRFSKLGMRDLLFISSFITDIYLIFLMIFFVRRIITAIRINLEGVHPNELFNNEYINSFSGAEKIRAYYIQRIIWFNIDLDYIFSASNKRWQLYRKLQIYVMFSPLILIGSFILFGVIEHYTK